jgi:competence protein ComEC
MAWAALGGLVYAAVAGFGLPTMRTVLMIAVVAWARAAACGLPMPSHWP